MCRDNFPGMHKHHIVFKSQGGLDFSLNLIRLRQEGHEGDKGPHRDRGTMQSHANFAASSGFIPALLNVSLSYWTTCPQNPQR